MDALLLLLAGLVLVLAIGEMECRLITNHFCHTSIGKTLCDIIGYKPED